MLDNYTYDNTCVEIDISNSFNKNSSLVDLKKFTQLKNLFCSGSNITSIINPSNQLTRLYCRKNKIKELDCFSSCIQLFMIDCAYNNITKLDNLPIGLLFLSCESNDLVDLINLPNGLERLNCSTNYINNLDHLPCSLLMLKANSYQLGNLKNLPNGLEILESDLLLSIESCNSLPKSLKVLNINKYKKQIIQDYIISEYCEKNNIKLI